MSVKAMSWAFSISIDPVKKIILLSLADCADDDGKSCYPGYALLAEKSSVCTKTVKRNIKQLVDLGLIKKQNRRKGKRFSSNKYELLLEVTKPVIKSGASKNDGDVKSPPDSHSPGDNQSRGGDSRSPQVGTPGVPVSVTEPSGNPDTDEHEPIIPDDVEAGIFGSHLLTGQHPYLFWFLVEMEKRAMQNPEALGDFAERLVKFGLASGYCQKSLDNFLNARRDSIDSFLQSQGRDDAISAWENHSVELIVEADSALTDFREYLANQEALL